MDQYSRQVEQAKAWLSPRIRKELKTLRAVLGCHHVRVSPVAQDEIEQLTWWFVAQRKQQTIDVLVTLFDSRQEEGTSAGLTVDVTITASSPRHTRELFHKNGLGWLIPGDTADLDRAVQQLHNDIPAVAKCLEDFLGVR